MAGGSIPTANPNKRLYNGGSEWQDDIDGLADYYSTFFREYDAVIGRFNGVDPMAEADDGVSIYTYSKNNPVMLNDPLGDDPNDPGKKKKNLAEEMQDNYRNWHDNMYGSGFRDIMDGISQQYGMPAWGNGGGDMSPFSSFGLYAGLKTHLQADGIPGKIGFNNFGEYGFWASENRPFTGKTKEGNENTLSEVGVAGGKVWIPLSGSGMVSQKNGWGSTGLGILMVLSGSKFIDKVAALGSVDKTSLLSKNLRRLSWRFNKPVGTFMLDNAGNIIYRTTTSVGAFTARWIPVVGYALLAYDFTKEIALPMAEGMSEYQESNRRSGNWIANLPH